MSGVRRIAQNMGFVLLGDFLNKVAAVALSVVLARKLGSELFGAIISGLVLGSVLQAFTDLGISQILYRDSAEDPEEVGKLVGTGLLIRVVLLVPGCAALYAIIHAVGYPKPYTVAIFAAGLGSMILALTHNYHFTFRARGVSHFEALGKFWQAVLFGGFVAWVWFPEQRFLDSISWGYAVTAGVTLVGVLAVARASGVRHQLYSWAGVQRLLSRGFPLGIQNVMVLIYLYADSIMLARMRGVAAVGLYQAAYRLVSALNIVGIAFSSGVFPLLFRRGSDGQAVDLNRVMYRSVKYLAILGVGMGLGVVMVGEEVIRLFYGTGYESSVNLLRILIWSEVLIFFGFSFSGILLAKDQRVVLSVQAVIAAVLNVSLNIPAIHLWGATGAAVTTLMTETVASTMLVGALWRLGIRLPWRIGRDLILIGLAGCTMIAVLWFLEGYSLLVLIPAGMLIYGATIWVFPVLDQVDKNFLRQLVYRKKPA